MKLSQKAIRNIIIIGSTFAIFYISTVIFKLPAYAPFLIIIGIICMLMVIFKREVYAVRGNLALNMGKNEQSLLFLEKAIKLNTKSSIAHLNYAILVLRDGDWETSLKSLEKANSLKPTIITDKNIRLTTGSSYWVKGDIKKAIEVLEEMRSKYDYVNGNVLTTLGYMYLLDGDFEKAFELTNKAIEDMPESAAAYDNLGQIYFRQNNFEEAKAAFEKALGFNDGLVDSLYFSCEIAERENDLEKAKGFIIKAQSAKLTALNTITLEQVQAKHDSLN